MSTEENPNNFQDEITEAVYKNFEQISQAYYQELDEYSNLKKLTDSPHEIVFDVTATVLEENLKGEIVGTKEISTQKYYIPVPINQDYDVFMQTFFSHIHNCLGDAASKANNKKNNE